MIFRFDIDKAIQASSVLLKTEQLRRMSRLRLLKLLYIADRELLAKRARPIIGDRPVAMDHGPVLSATYDLIKGEDDRAPTKWERYFKNDGRDVVWIDEPGIGSLSRREIETLHEVARRYQDRTDWDIAEYTHSFPEWIKNQPQKGSSKKISTDDLLEAVGLSPLKDQLIADSKAEAAAVRLLGAA